MATKAFIQVQDSERKDWESIPWVTRTFPSDKEATKMVSDMADIIGREVRLTFPIDEKDTPFTLNGIYL